MATDLVAKKQGRFISLQFYRSEAMPVLAKIKVSPRLSVLLSGGSGE